MFSFVKFQQFLLSMLESRLIFLLKTNFTEKSFQEIFWRRVCCYLISKKKTKAKTKIVSSFSETTTHIVSKKRSDKKGISLGSFNKQITCRCFSGFFSDMISHENSLFNIVLVLSLRSDPPIFCKLFICERGKSPQRKIFYV